MLVKFIKYLRCLFWHAVFKDALDDAAPIRMSWQSINLSNEHISLHNRNFTLLILLFLSKLNPAISYQRKFKSSWTLYRNGIVLHHHLLAKDFGFKCHWNKISIYLLCLLQQLTLESKNDAFCMHLRTRL